MTISKELVDFLLTVEIVNEKADESFSYERVKVDTNKYRLELFIKSRIPSQRIEPCYDEIREILSEYGHPAGRKTIIGVIVLFCISLRSVRNEFLIHSFFKLIRKIRLKQYLIYHPKQGEKIPQLKFNDFIVGHIDYLKFSRFIASHSGSDYATRYKDNLDNNAGIEMKNHEIPVFDIYGWLLILKIDVIDIPEGCQECINIYLTEVSLEKYESFKEAFALQQKFITAFLGLNYPLEQLQWVPQTLVNIYYKFLQYPKGGWVLPFSPVPLEVRWPDPRIVRRANSFIAVNEHDLLAESNEYSRYLGIVSEQFCNAELHIDLHHYDQAYIDYFVGLDFLLAPDNERSRKLKQRITLLTYQTFQATFEDHYLSIEALYEVRNRYVHSAVKVKEPELITLRNVARIVLKALFNVHVRNLNSPKLTFKQWIERIDLHVQDAYKNRILSKKDSIEIGLKDSGDFVFETSLHVSSLL